MNTNRIKNWMFVTGVPRSGTTFVGKILSLPKQTDYIHEPFNPQCGIPGIAHWYRHVRPSLDTTEMREIDTIIQSLMTYDCHLKKFVPKADPWKKKIIKQIIGGRGPINLSLAKLNIFHNSAVIKDPIGSLITEHLYLNYNIKPVIVIKHPASFIASLKRVNWWPTLSELSDQQSLTEDYFSDEPNYLYQKWSEPYLEAAAFWRVIYKILLTQAQKYPDWQIITHEDLSLSPISTFQSLYERLNLSWSSKVENKIRSLTQSPMAGDVKKGTVQDFKRNSASIFETRRDSLSIEERKNILDIVGDVSSQIYSPETFAV